eukprot:COSAG01_NODE_55417_length_325_cov_0.809735_1_plen_28_part_10
MDAVNKLIVSIHTRSCAQPDRRRVGGGE